MDTTPVDWQNLYTGERRRSRILGAATVAVSLLAVAAGAWGLSNADATRTSGPGQPGGPGTSQVGPAQGPLAQDLAATLFSSDGSVNEGLLEQFMNRMPGGLDQFLQVAVQNGDLTQDQAEALRAAATGLRES